MGLKYTPILALPCPPHPTPPHPTHMHAHAQGLCLWPPNPATHPQGLNILPMALGFPQKATIPAGLDILWLLLLALGSFLAQLLLSRGLQLMSASRAACIKTSQVLC